MKTKAKSFAITTVAQARSDLYSTSTRGTSAKRNAGVVLSEWESDSMTEDQDQPLRISKSNWGKTWGKIILRRGRLTQRHRDVLDAIMYCAKSFERKKDSDKGSEGYERIYIEYDAADVLRLLRIQHQQSWLDMMIDDLIGTVVELQTGRGNLRTSMKEGLVKTWSTETVISRQKGQIVSDGFMQTKDAIQRGGLMRLDGIVLGPAFVFMFDNDLNVYMSKAIPKILDLEYPISRAIARWMLSHSVEQNHIVDDLFNSLGVPSDQSNRRKLFEQIKKSDLEGLAKLNITLAKGDTPKKAMLNFKPDPSICWIGRPEADRLKEHADNAPPRIASEIQAVKSSGDCRALTLPHDETFVPATVEDANRHIGAMIQMLSAKK